MTVGKLRLGYVTENLSLQKHGIHSSKTARAATIKKEGKQRAIELAISNLSGLLQILQWNEEHGVKFYRITSMLCPHITNPVFIKERRDYKKLAYSLKPMVPLLKSIGEYARTHGHRLTFHPDPFISLGTHSDDVLLRNTRELWYHATIMDIMGLDLNSTICMHGGGFYGNKPDTMKRWIKRFNDLPITIKRRIAIENDEFSYSIQDILWLSAHVNPYPLEFDGHSWKPSSKFKIPVIFDIFHYYCYNQTIKIRELAKQWDLKDIWGPFNRSWGSRTPKMHISEQRRGGQRGAHADYVKELPLDIRRFPSKYGDLDVMIEAKAKEKSLMYLRKKYDIKT